MGIQNLLRFLKPFIAPVHIKKYSGKRVGVDAYSWLHKGAYSCSMELCLDSKADKARQYLNYFMHHINLLKHYKITPVVVFDGGNTPCKADTENGRYRKRKANLELAKEKLKEGNVNAAIEFFRRAVRVTPAMAHDLIQILRSERVEFIVAPYEADAQLAYLSTLDSDQGGIAAIITEDSDLIAYGCQAVIFKMDRHGNGEEFLMDKVLNNASDGLSFKHFDKELFTGMCVLAGCDFLPSIPGIGTKRAHSLVSKYRNLDRVLSVLKLHKKYEVPEDYSESFGKAIAVFHCARIYDVKTKSLQPLKPLEQKHVQSLNGELDNLGPDLPPSIAAAIAEGHLNPITMEAFDHLPEAKACYDTESAPYLDQINSNESQVTSTQENCITIFSALQSSNQKSAIVEKSVLDEQKIMKEALALGKLVAPVESQQVVNAEANRREVLNNNPFKRRKAKVETSEEEESSTQIVSASTMNVEGSLDVPNNGSFKRRKVMVETSEEEERCTQIVSASPMNVEGSLDVHCSSSPESQVTVESKPPIKFFVRKEKIQKKSVSKNSQKSVKSGKTGILKFFERL